MCHPLSQRPASIIPDSAQHSVWFRFTTCSYLLWALSTEMELSWLEIQPLSRPIIRELPDVEGKRIIKNGVVPNRSIYRFLVHQESKIAPDGFTGIGVRNSKYGLDVCWICMHMTSKVENLFARPFLTGETLYLERSLMPTLGNLSTHSKLSVIWRASFPNSFS